MVNKKVAESKDDRFIRVAEKRVQKILNDIESLSKCSNKRMYAWDEKQLQVIWKAIDNEIKLCKMKYGDKKITKFSLKQ